MLSWLNGEQSYCNEKSISVSLVFVCFYGAVSDQSQLSSKSKRSDGSSKHVCVLHVLHVLYVCAEHSLMSPCTLLTVTDIIRMQPLMQCIVHW